ncbi:MAG: DUF2333 family protein [Proteobacteria bacterium]|nr:DUF2333 family protein [Pseudomonadota bacterium]
MSGKKDKSENAGFGSFASLRIVLGIVIAMGCLFLFAEIISFFSGTPEEKSPYKQVVEKSPILQKADEYIEGLSSREANVSNPEFLDQADENLSDQGLSSDYAEGDGASHGEMMDETQDVSPMYRQSTYPEAVTPPPATTHTVPMTRRVVHEPQVMPRQVIGIAFVDALIRPMEYELENRFWGWRPNDLRIFKFGMDNVENYQLGVREVTRRSVDILTERIARTGSNVSYNKSLNDAVNSLTVNPASYWWPSAEGEYRRAMDDLRQYKELLKDGKESFYTRPDNLIPLLVEFRTRLGDCDDKLVRREGDLESQVTTFEADDRFYYSKGVASAILPILEAVQEDFSQTLKTRDGIETLHRAIDACRGASLMSPWMVTEGNYNGFIANHRANMATYIGHARFYIGVLIKTLST